MALSNNQTSFSQIQSILGGSNPISMSEYYYGGEYSQGFHASGKTVPNNGNRGYVFGGTLNVAGGYEFYDIDRVNLNTDTSSLMTYYLPFNGFSMTAVKSSANAYITAASATVSGFTSVIADIGCLSFANETTRLSSTRLLSARSQSFGLNSSTHGYIAGGTTATARESTIERIIFSTETAESTSSTISVIRVQGASTSTSATGYMVAGKGSGRVILSSIDSLSFSTLTASLLSQGLSSVRDSLAASGVESNSIYGGGTVGTSAITELVNLQHANLSVTSLSSALTTGKRGAAGFEGVDNGYFAAGHSSATATLSEIDKVSHINFNVANLSSTLSNGKTNTVGVSNANIATPAIKISDFNGFIPLSGYIMGGSNGVDISTSILAYAFSSESLYTLGISSLLSKDCSVGASSIHSTYDIGGKTTNGVATDNIQALRFSDETITNNSDSLSVARHSLASTNSKRYAFMYGGVLSNNTSSVEIDNLTFDTSAKANWAMSLEIAKKNMAGVSIGSAGYIAGGETANGFISSIDKHGTYALGTNVIVNGQTIKALNTITATISSSRKSITSVNSKNSGYFYGGMNATVSNVIDKLIAVNDTISTPAVLLDSNSNGAGINTLSSGYFVGGINGNSTMNNFITSINFATESLSNNAASILVNKKDAASGQCGSL